MIRELKFRRYGLDGFDYFDLMRDIPMAFERFYDTTTAKNHDKIEQYTGLKDKYGKEIYEGDIVKYDTVYQGDWADGTGEVNFGYLEDSDGWNNNEYLCWRVNNLISLDHGGDWVEVVGNIHENPELLKESQ